MDRRGWIVLGVIAIVAIAWLVLFGPGDGAWTPEDREGAIPDADDARLRAAEGAVSEAAPALEGRGDAAPVTPTAPRKAEAQEGIITLTYEQGWSFLDRKVVPGSADASDLVLSNLAGGASSVTLRMPSGGIANADPLRAKLPNVRTARGLADGVLRGRPRELLLREDATSSSDRPHSDVFIARTRRGEWLLLTVVFRDESQRDWQSYRVTIEYTLNPDAPVFGEGAADVIAGGFEVASGAVTAREAAVVAQIEAAMAERMRPFVEAMQALEERAATYRAAVTRAGHRVDAVMVRQKARALGARSGYVAATYSFEKQTRDDAKATGNDWDFVLSHGIEGPWLRVRTVTDDRSTIWDLGPIDFEQALRGDVQQVEAQIGVKVRAHHLYLIHTLDRQSDHWVLLKALSIGEGEELIFEWRAVSDPTLLRRVLEPRDKELLEPYARIQILSDHGGGNPHRAYLDGSKNAYIKELKAEPLDLSTPSTQRKSSAGSQAFVIGGYIPEGRVFRVTSVEFSVHCDKPDRVDTLIRVGPYTILHVQNERWRRDGPNDGLIVSSADRGVETLKTRDLPIRRTIAVDIPIARDQEKHVLVAVPSYTRIDVILRGRLEPTPKTPWPLGEWTEGARRSAASAWMNYLGGDDTESRRLMFLRSFHNLDHGELWLAGVRDQLTDDEMRRRADKMLELLR